MYLLLKLDEKRWLKALTVIGADSVVLLAFNREVDSLRAAGVVFHHLDSVRVAEIAMLTAGEQAALADRDKAQRGEKKAKAWGKFWRTTTFISSVAAVVFYLMR